MSKLSTKPPSGMRDFLPAELARRGYVVGVVRRVYERYGFVPLETPSMENIEILLGKYGEDEKLVYRVLRRGDKLARALAQPEVGEADLADLALRYDLTVPLARVVANYGELPRYFKRYQIQPVWRADRPGKGRFRELYQCDVDVIGSKSLVAEAEVCAAVAEVLVELRFTDFEILLNHRGLLRALIASAGIDTAQERTSLVAVDKLDKIGEQGVAEELVARGVDAAAGKRLLERIAWRDDRSADELRTDLDNVGDAAVAELLDLLGLLEGTPAAGRVHIRPDLARGLDYYTGPIFEVRSPQLNSSLAGGGRYDELVGVFGSRPIPAVGFSIGLDRIVGIMVENELFPELRVGPQIMLCWMGVEPASALRVAHVLRAQGLRVEVYPEPAKLKKQLQYADQGAHAPFAAIVGEDELASGTVTLKELATGDQVKLAVGDVAGYVAKRKA